MNTPTLTKIHAFVENNYGLTMLIFGFFSVICLLASYMFKENNAEIGYFPLFILAIAISMQVFPDTEKSKLYGILVLFGILLIILSTIILYKWVLSGTSFSHYFFSVMVGASPLLLAGTVVTLCERKKRSTNSREMGKRPHGGNH